ncbi:TRAP transporter substrate-binding protein [Saccharospirillum mangrovi]|uniref:TRAP transporter substrate-binding protein n=1 Tax=Saccharospirillum mangrovi TaxID=2161747 RepID=UPI000D37256E|nr:TRAP transporter substrate-binding protein [Saccharospirillum mangrovi]
MKTTLLSTVLATACCAALVSTSVQAEKTLKLAHFVPPAHVLTGAIIEPLKDGVEEASGGDLQIDVYPGGELGAGPMEQYVRALQGVADITWGLAGYTSSQFERSMIVEMPGAIPEGMTGYDMLWNAYDEHLEREFPGTHPLALWVSEPNIFIMKDHDIRTPDDLDGLKMRVSGSMAAAMIARYGATPVQMPAGEMYNALQTGLIDGIVTGASAITDFKLDEVANSYTIGAPMGHIMFYLVMNQRSYDGLTDAQRTVLDEHSGRWLSRHGEEGWNALAERTLEAVAADSNNTVINLSDAEIAPFETIADAFRAERLSDSGTANILSSMRGE